MSRVTERKANVTFEGSTNKPGKDHPMAEAKSPRPGAGANQWEGQGCECSRQGDGGRRRHRWADGGDSASKGGVGGRRLRARGGAPGDRRRAAARGKRPEGAWETRPRGGCREPGRLPLPARYAPGVGRLLAERARAGGRTQRSGAASAAVHRADLQALLLLREAWREDHVRPRLRRCAGFEQDDGRRHGSSSPAARRNAATSLIGRRRPPLDGSGLDLFGPPKLPLRRLHGLAGGRRSPSQVNSCRGARASSRGGEGARFGCAHIGEWQGLLVRDQERRGGRRGRSRPAAPPGPKADPDAGSSTAWHHPVRRPDRRPPTSEAMRRDGLFDREPRSDPLGGGQSHPPGDAAHPA